MMEVWTQKDIKWQAGIIFCFLKQGGYVEYF